MNSDILLQTAAKFFFLTNLNLLNWSNRKIIQMSYEHNTEYTTNTLPRVIMDINSKGKTWLSFNKPIVCQVSVT